ncbi:conserved hypothetical protein [Nostocoides japonicum T1-X7]|uniref:DUF3866 domain-containing protein n=1 Tax=Nostocoides japonicum T1-X7 TaxID=1194083 RepID=A0A077LTK3_9MICO|nr:DUF3866 family protein [Tetrasphaera japonica]CCH76581.1 conserved hypothetical protein [Tetrasphaera japonica T1-X7]
MMQWREGTVVRETGRWAGAVEYAVEVSPAPDATSDSWRSGTRSGPVHHPTSDVAGEVRALAYPAVVGEPRPGDRVLLNVSALARGLGTGGLALVVAVPDRLPADPPPAAGHIVKARYTPQQQMFLAVDEQDSPHHATLSDDPSVRDGDLLGLPVVVADLHSALPAVLAGLLLDRPDARVVYLMTDGGALPLAFSRTVATLRSTGWLAASVTVGQAFGGDHEAVSLHSGLLAARHVLGADVAVVVQGPGNVGTGTPWGFSGLACGEALNAAWTLHGHGIAALRVSGSDPRGRHRGISHHSLTAYGRIVLGAADVPVCAPENPLQQEVLDAAEELSLAATGRLSIVEVPTEGLLDALAEAPVRLSTMGRGLDVDPEPFLYAAVAGRHAASLVPATPT